MAIHKKIRDYIKNVISELKRVSWAKSSDLFKTTVVVIVLSLIIAIFILICDLIFSRLLHVIIR